jgi:hypothetical protein
LADARRRKTKKYEPIVKEANDWLQANLEEIQIKHRVSSVKVETKFIIISNLGVVPKETERDMYNIVSSQKNVKLR